MTDLERLLGHVNQTETCWLWTGAIGSGGYGMAWSSPRKAARRAHRLVYEALVGPIPDGLELDHLCRVRHCVRPDHLEPVTHAENKRRSFADFGPHGGSVVNAAKTNCPHGHPYDEANTLRSRGKRYCRACRKAATRRSAA